MKCQKSLNTIYCTFRLKIYRSCLWGQMSYFNSNTLINQRVGCPLISALIMRLCNALLRGVVLSWWSLWNGGRSNQPWVTRQPIRRRLGFEGYSASNTSTSGFLFILRKHIEVLECQISYYFRNRVQVCLIKSFLLLCIFWHSCISTFVPLMTVQNT